MINELFNAFNAEIQALLALQMDVSLQSATIIDDTQFDEDNMPAYTLPLIIISINTSSDDGQFIGGFGKNEYQILLKIYNYQPNSDNSEGEGYSTSLLEIVDIFRGHFLGYIFLTDLFKNYISNYNFTYMLSSINKDEKLKSAQGIITGYILDFTTISIDNTITPITYAQMNNVEEIIGDVIMIISPISVSFTNVGGAQTITFESNVKATINKIATWIAITKTATNGNDSFIITCAANLSGLTRRTTVTVQYWGVNTQLITINQTF